MWLLEGDKWGFLFCCLFTGCHWSQNRPVLQEMHWAKRFTPNCLIILSPRSISASHLKVLPPSLVCWILLVLVSLWPRSVKLVASGGGGGGEGRGVHQTTHHPPPPPGGALLQTSHLPPSHPFRPSLSHSFLSHLPYPSLPILPESHTPNVPHKLKCLRKPWGIYMYILFSKENRGIQLKMTVLAPARLQQLIVTWPRVLLANYSSEELAFLFTLLVVMASIFLRGQSCHRG